MKKDNKVFMAFASGSESVENTRKLYIGVAPVYVAMVNPNKAAIEKFFDTEINDEPTYVSDYKVDENTTVPQVRLDFFVMTKADKANGIEAKTKITLFLRDSIRYNRDKTKVQVVDKYGQFAWPTIEEAKAKAIPQYASGPANIDADYRPAYEGEEELTDFIKQYLNIPRPSFTYKDKNTGELVTRVIKNLDDALARLDNIPNYFKGDVKELENILKLQPSNVVKTLFGVRTTDDNKQYQAVYTQKFLKNSVDNYSKLEEEVQARKEAGAYPNTEFIVGPFREYSVEATSFEEKADDLPFSRESASKLPWE